MCANLPEAEGSSLIDLVVVERVPGVTCSVHGGNALSDHRAVHYLMTVSECCAGGSIPLSCCG